MTHRSIESQKSRNNFVREGAMVGALSLIAAAVMADVQAGSYTGRKRAIKADMVDFPDEHATQSNYIFSGYHTNGRVIANNMHRHLENLGTQHYGVHPEKGLSIDSYKEEVIKRRKQEGYQPARIYAMSMGALVVSKMFSDESFRKEFGEVCTLVMDGGLSGKKDVSTSSKIAMGAGAILPVTFMTDKLYHLVTGRETHKIIDHAPEVTDLEAYEHILSSTKTSFDAAKSQILFMDHNSVDQMDLEGFGQSITGPIIYLSSVRDDVLNPHRAVQEYSDALQRNIEFWIDTKRAVSTHASGPERPQGVIDTMLYQNQNNYRIKTIRPYLAKSASELWVPQAQAA